MTIALNEHPHHGDLLTPAELAQRLSVSTGHLKNLRSQRRGVPFIKHGGTVRYRYADVLAFEESHLISTTSA